MDRSGVSGNKVFGRFAEPARQVLAARAVRSTAGHQRALQLASRQAQP